ncbi:ferrochelatase [Sphingorhabdus pulchriflava]|uniref:Ferrochelatase n=1 Tax=Sphingorhabdus pulchriflava TaxID=2292257 RepID=A0A371B5Z6_9SPHN|nr:ferrochelatase [Sphingorhabdus pulchriflava]RDV02932.1 ferrochelatase [Sphingorhabdus pulchriflava]
MMLPASHPPVAAPKVGVLLVNLGTPDAPNTAAVRRYLAEFLSDRRVVEIPSLIWKPILHGIILRTRPAKSAANYAKVWMDEGSPLAVYTNRQASALQSRLGSAIDVRVAMRYGQPAIASQLSAMKADGCNRILVAPLYPQYSGATTATVVDEVGRALAAMRWQPALRTLPAYHDDPAHIAALATRLKTQLAELDFEPDAIVASFHGMPERTLQLGDPYHCHCQKTARLLSEALGKPLTIAFQSRFGRAKWLEPSTEDTIKRLANEGKKRVAIFAPGFSADCLETLEELAMLGMEQFEEAGGEHYAYLPCLNDSEPGMDMLETLIRRELSGWL